MFPLPSLRRGALLAAALLVPLLGCEDDDGPVGPGGITGSADLTRYVAIGNSLTAGFQSGALGAEGQACSYPLLLAQQAGVAEGFEQPDVSAPGISAPGSGQGRLELVSLQPLVIQRATPAGQPINAGLDRPFNNLGVPGALGFEALTAQNLGTSLTGNPFYDLVLRNQGTFRSQAAALGATFITVALGSNEVLGYATRGGDPALAPGLPIPPSSFGLVYQTLITSLLGTTDQIVLFNVPDVTVIPFLTTVPPVLVNPATMQPVLGPDGQPIPLLGPDGPLAAGDLVSLNATALLQQGIGVPVAAGGTGQPLPTSVVLNVAEQAVAAAAVQAYNGIIAQVAQTNGLSVVDLNALLDQAATTGITVEGVTLTADFVTGGIFSLDGVHPTCKGYGIMANALIDVINAAFDASIPTVSIAALPGVPTPAGARVAAARTGLPELRGFRQVPLPF